MPAREYKLPDLNSIVQGDSDMEVESVSNNSPEVRPMGVSLGDQGNNHHNQDNNNMIRPIL